VLLPTGKMGKRVPTRQNGNEMEIKKPGFYKIKTHAFYTNIIYDKTPE
jgi:hypothetical protein